MKDTVSIKYQLGDTEEMFNQVVTWLKAQGLGETTHCSLGTGWKFFVINKYLNINCLGGASHPINRYAIDNNEQNKLTKIKTTLKDFISTYIKPKEEQDWCVILTIENASVIREYMNRGTEGWKCNSDNIGYYYGYRKGYGKESHTTQSWGKLLSTEEFYQKIGHKVEEEKWIPKAGDWVTKKTPWSELCDGLITHKIQSIDEGFIHVDWPASPNACSFINEFRKATEDEIKAVSKSKERESLYMVITSAGIYLNKYQSKDLTNHTISAYIAISNNSFTGAIGTAISDFNSSRVASPEEIEWIEACIEANKFIPKEEALKKPTKEEFKEGDWVVVLPEDEYYCNAEQGKAQKINMIHLTLLPYNLLFASGRTNSYSKIRRALPHEIPGNNVAVQAQVKQSEMSKEELLAEAKRRYPPGTIFNSTGGWNGCEIPVDVIFIYENDTITVSSPKNSFLGKVYSGSGSRWAEIISQLKPERKRTTNFSIGDQISFNEDVTKGVGIIRGFTLTGNDCIISDYTGIYNAHNGNGNLKSYSYNEYGDSITLKSTGSNIYRYLALSTNVNIITPASVKSISFEEEYAKLSIPTITLMDGITLSKKALIYGTPENHLQHQQPIILKLKKPSTRLVVV